MKEIAKVFQAVESRDNQALARIANKAPVIATARDIQSAPREIKLVVSDLLSKLETIFPASRAMFERDPEYAKETRRQWLMAMLEGGVKTQAQIDAGLFVARKCGKPFLPSPGEFVAWCNDGLAQQVGLPSADDVRLMFSRYCRDRGVMAAHEMEWPAPIYYHVVLKVHREMLDRDLSEAELMKAIQADLNQWARVLSSGGKIPPIRIAIEAKTQKDPEIVSRKMAQLEADAKAGSAGAAKALALLKRVTGGRK